MSTNENNNPLRVTYDNPAAPLDDARAAEPGETCWTADRNGRIYKANRDYVDKNMLPRLILSPEEIVAREIGEQIDAAAQRETRAATELYYGTCLRLAAGEKLTDSEAVLFRAAATKLGRQSPGAIGEDIQTGKQIFAARRWLVEHKNDQTEFDKLQVQIAAYDAEINTFIEKVRRKAGPIHEKSAALMRNMGMVLGDARRTACQWDKLIGDTKTTQPAGKQ